MEQEILRGIVGGILFKNDENGYCVLRMQCDNGQTVTVVGTIPQPTVGEKLMVTGHWISHPSYGKQFEAEFLDRVLPETNSEILKYLSGRAIKGIGPVLAARIVRKFGTDTLRIIESEPEKLATISGISHSKAIAISESFRLQSGVRHLMEYLALHQLPSELAVKLYKLYGNASQQMLRDDPYLLTEDDFGCPFQLADRFATQIGIDPSDTRRIDAAILHTMQQALSAGHSFLPEAKLINLTQPLLDCGEDPVLIGIDRLAECGRLERDRLAEKEVIYLPQLYEAELGCLDILIRHAATTFPLPQDWKHKLQQVKNATGVSYSATQLEAMEQAMTHGLLLITGGPGTGKTTLISGILELFDCMGIKCLMAAPTGRAAKRLTEVTGREASTIHRLLECELDPFTGKTYFGRDESNPLKAGAIIIDEMSMVDVQLFHSLLCATRSNARLILVGDPDQLPPVGPGCPLRDCLKSEVIPTVCLTEIFRQAQESLIVMNAHRINQGELPDLSRKDRDFFFLPCRSEAELQVTVAELVSQRLPNNMGIPPDQIQVLTPTRKGMVGTWDLNQVLQERLNPPHLGKKEKKYGNIFFREGDRVMQIRNNYDIIWKKLDDGNVGTGIFNGDVGTIQTVDVSSETVSILFDDRIADYTFDMLSELEPAYAMTVHKSQGSEYRAVVLCAWSASPYLLSRSVLYTAVTRAKELLIIAGREDVVHAMMANAKSNSRYTGLKLRLKQLQQD